MKFKFLLSFLLLGFFISSGLAQMKDLNLPKTKIDIKDVHVKSKAHVTQSQRLNTRPVVFRQVDNSNLLLEKKGLKAGFLNSRSVPSYIEGTLKAENENAGKANNPVLDYLKAAAPAMKISQPEAEFLEKSTSVDELNMTHTLMQQMINGVPIFGGEIILHAKDGQINFLNGSYYPTIDMNTTPNINGQQSYNIVNSDLGVMEQYNSNVTWFEGQKKDPELVVYPNSDTFSLVYHVTEYKNLIERWEYFVDAHTGKIVDKYPSICKFHNHDINTEEITSSNESVSETMESPTEVLLDGSKTATALDLFDIQRTINTYQVGSRYYMIDGSRDIFASTPSQMPNNPNGVIWTIDAQNTSPANYDFKYDHITSTNNSWNNKTGVSAHYNAGKAFEYFRNVFNRSSINGSGGNIISLINVADDDGKSMGNAFWNGQAMFYGNGDNAFYPLARGLDVAGHEMTHGVIEGTANLTYQGESGALNESFADVFGVMIDRNNWQIGETVVKPSAYPSGALRDMADPHNGAPTNNYNRGWQPKHYNERYIGDQDNGGVHINSGIPNHAFYRFATAVGKDKAEKVYYRALTNYLTKSAKFSDCRVAVVKAASDLYSTAEVNAAKQAFDAVGVFGDEPGDYQNDIDQNPGQDFVLMTGSDYRGLYLYNTNGEQIVQLTNNTVISKPSISDDGSEIVYIGGDKKMYYIYIDWNPNNSTFSEDVLSSDPVWRNAVISKDGSKIAALLNQLSNEVYVFYFGPNGVVQNTFELYNPTYSSGVKTGDVNYADAMEFDLSGEYIIYDAENEIQSAFGGSIKYWDIGFVKVWNNQSNSFSFGEVSKLFTSLPQNTSAGNPSFSKNSPYIIAFDFIDENDEVTIYGANIETGDLGLVFENNTLGFPNFSSADSHVLFDNDGNTATNIGIGKLGSNKIEVVENPILFTTNRRWAVWFSNGQRVLSSTEFTSIEGKDLFKIEENPASQNLTLIINDNISSNYTVSVMDINGRTMLNKEFYGEQRPQLDISNLSSGAYIVTVKTVNSLSSQKFVKQ